MNKESHTLESHIENLREKGYIGAGRIDPFERRLRSDHRIMEEKAHREKKPISFSVPVTLTVADGVDPMKIRFHFSYDPFTNKTRNSGVNVVLGQFRHHDCFETQSACALTGLDWGGLEILSARP